MDPRNWVYFRPVLDTWTIRRTLLSCLPKVTNLWFPWRLFVMQWVKYTVRHISHSARLPFIKIWNGLSLYFFHRNPYKIYFFLTCVHIKYDKKDLHTLTSFMTLQYFSIFFKVVLKRLLLSENSTPDTFNETSDNVKVFALVFLSFYIKWSYKGFFFFGILDLCKSLCIS